MAATQTNLITDLTRIIQDSSYDSAELLEFLNQAMREVAAHPSVLLHGLETEAELTTSTTVPYVALPTNYQKNLFFIYNSTKNWQIHIRPSLGDMIRRYSMLDQSGTITNVAIRGRALHYQRIPATEETLEIHYYRKPYDMATYTARTISFDAATGTIADGASGFGDFNVGQVVDVRGTSDNNTSFTITAATSALLTVTESVTDESAGSDFNLKSRPDGIPDHLVKPLLLNKAAMDIFSEIEQGVEGAKVNTAYHQAQYQSAMAALVGFIGPEGRAPQEISDELALESFY